MGRQIKICHVTSVHAPEDGRIFRRSCVSCAKAGYDTYLVERGNSYEKEGVKIIGLGDLKRGRLYRMLCFSRMAYKEASQINATIYHLHDPELLRFASRLKRKGGKVVFDSHEDYIEQIKTKEYLPKCIAKIVSRMFYFYSKYVFSHIDGVVYAGNGDYKSSYEGMCKRLVAIDNYPWLEELYDKYDETIKRESNSLCYVGGLDEARGITQIIKAAYNAGCTLYLAGEFSSSKYREQLEAMKEYSCVKYLGVVSHDEIRKLLQRVGIGMCTLLDKGQYYRMTNLPTKVYEYMSMALPVIINDSEYNKKVFNDFGLGICVNPLKEEEIVNAIKKLTNDEDMRQRCGLNGRNAVKELFCWDKEQHKLLRLYRSIIEEPENV